MIHRARLESGRSESFAGERTLELKSAGRRELAVHREESKSKEWPTLPTGTSKYGTCFKKWSSGQDIVGGLDIA